MAYTFRALFYLPRRPRALHTHIHTPMAAPLANTGHQRQAGRKSGNINWSRLFADSLCQKWNKRQQLHSAFQDYSEKNPKTLTFLCFYCTSTS